MASDSCELLHYRPTATRAVYDSIMNGEKVQALLLQKAQRIAGVANGEGITTTADVRPGKHRAHARASAKRQKVDSFRARGHNLRIDRVLQAAIDAAKE